MDFFGWASIGGFITKVVDNVEEQKVAYIRKHVTFTGVDGVTSPYSDVDENWWKAHGGDKQGNVILTGLDGATALISEADAAWVQKHIRSLAFRLAAQES